MNGAGVVRSATGGQADVNRSIPGGGAARRSAEDRQPKYLRIYAELRDRITSGRWAAGSSLPPQRDLAGEFGVSIMTLRQALQLLADEGLVAARHGSGTYVAARYEYDLGHLRSFAADLAGQGAEISTRLLATEIITPPEQVGARLGGPGQVLQLRRLRLAGGRPSSCRPRTCRCRWPLASTRRSWPGAACTRCWPGTGSRSPGPRRRSAPVRWGPSRLAYLGRPAGSPALLSHRVSFTAAGVAVVDDHAVLPGDSVAITANRSADRLDVHYSLRTGP